MTHPDNEHISGRASEHLDKWFQSYSKIQHPIDVSFRNLVGSIPVNDLSHSVYPYPARLLRQIPRFFLNCEQLAQPGDVILDPFCGSGTVLVEAYIAQKIGWGMDKNPFARLLSKVKTTPIKRDAAVQAAMNVLERAKASRLGTVPDVINVDFWFSPQIKGGLARLLRAVTETDVPLALRQYLLVCLALTADRCSFRDPRIPVPVRNHDWQIIAAKQKRALLWRTFESVAISLAERVSLLPIQPDILPIIDGEDAALAQETYLKTLVEKIQRPRLILTSPPYGAAQKYIRSTSIALGWTGLATASELNSLERRLIGREHFHRHELADLRTPSPELNAEISLIALQNPVRAAIYAEYFRSMDAVIADLATLLLPGGFLVLVAGSNTVTGRVLETHLHLRNLAVHHGLTPILELRDKIRGRVLMTKRALSSSPLHWETIHVLHKVEEKR